MVEESKTGLSCELVMAELRHIIKDLDELKNEAKNARDRLELSEKAAVILYVSKEQFAPIKNIVYGMVAIILTSVIGAILTLVLRK